MKKRFQVTNFYKQTLNGDLNLVDGIDGIIPITVPTIEDNKDYYILIDPLNFTGDRVVVRCYNEGGVVKYYGWSYVGNHDFYEKTDVQINDVAELFNFIYSNIDDFGNTIKTGDLEVTVSGGRIINTSQSDDVIADSTILLEDNSISYIYFDNLLKEFKSQSTDPASYWTCAKITTVAGVITLIEDYRSNYIGIGAELLQLTQTEIDALVGIKAGQLVYNKTSGLPQYYSGGVWFDWSTGTPLPRASETIEGKVRVATDIEYESGTDIGGDGARLMPKVSKASQQATTTQKGRSRFSTDEEVFDETQIDTMVSPKNLVDFSNRQSSLSATYQYIAGENIGKGNTVFTEEEVQFSFITQYTNIGDNSANSAVSVKKIGSGNAGIYINLALLKIGTPTQPLWIRIEGDNAGSPSGVLINNSIASITQSSLTTSIQNIQITFSSLSIDKGTPFHIVCIQSTDGNYDNKVIDASNYYGIGTKAEKSNTMYGMIYNGSSWQFENKYGSTQTDSMAGGNSTDARGNISSHTITPLYDMILDSLSYGDSISGGNIPLGTAIGGNILQKYITYTIPFTYSGYSGGGGGAVTSNYKITDASHGTQNGGFNISSRKINMMSSGKVFCSTNIAESKLIARTSALYNYMFNNTINFSKHSYILGDEVSYDFLGKTKSLTGLEEGNVYYMSNSLGEISLSGGLNLIPVGYVKDGYLLISGFNQIPGTTYTLASSGNSVDLSSLTSYTKIGEILNTGKGGWFTVSFYLYAGSGKSTYGQIYKNGVPYGPEVVRGSAGGTTYTQNLLFKKGDYIQLYARAGVSGYNNASSLSVKYSIYELPNTGLVSL